MQSTTLALAALTLLTRVALAVPNVTVVPLSERATDSCFGYPSRSVRPGFDITGAFYIKAEADESEGVTGLFAEPRAISWGGKTIEPLALNLLKSTRSAHARYSCDNGALKMYGSSSGSLTVSKDINNAFLRIGEGYQPAIYNHDIDGVRQDGIFLGAENQTTWGFRLVTTNLGEQCGRPYYEAKLANLPLDPETEPTAGYPPDFYGFLKVLSS